MQGIPEAEAANAITNQMALAARNTANGQGMPGAMSDADRAFLSAMQPGITRTPAGNKLMIKIARDTEQYRMRANAVAQQYINARQGDDGLAEHMATWMQANPMSVVVPGHEEARQQFSQEEARVNPNWAVLAPPPEAIAMIRAARGAPDEANHIEKFNKRFNGGRPGLAEQIMSDEG